MSRDWKREYVLAYLNHTADEEVIKSFCDNPHFTDDHDARLFREAWYRALKGSKKSYLMGLLIGSIGMTLIICFSIRDAYEHQPPEAAFRHWMRVRGVKIHDVYHMRTNEYQYTEYIADEHPLLYGDKRVLEFGVTIKHEWWEEVKRGQFK